MSPITTIIILAASASFLASTLVVSAAMLSSRISRGQNQVEQFPLSEEQRPLFGNPLALESEQA